VTYLRKNQQVVCQGCHEVRHYAPHAARIPLALRRDPSPIEPDVAGSNPFNFPRLVQPVLDKHCADCHAKHKKAPDLSDTPAKRYGWSTSYTNLASKYGFYFHSQKGCFGRGHDQGDGARTIPGRFGARQSRLFKLLDKGHHGVKLSTEDFHRITLWLDCNSDFYGAYEETKAQAKGEIVYPSLE
jgi:hypothetical protein